MRIAVTLTGASPREAQQAERLGFDAVWIDERVVPAPLVLAASLAPSTRGLRIVACVEAGPHPVALAEEAAVADLASNGRLILVVRSDDGDLLAETVDVLRLAWRPRPFRHEGPRWRIPAGLPEHELDSPKIRVTPAPAQLELPVWTTGAAGPDVARSRGLAFVADDVTPLDPQDARPLRVRRYDQVDLERLRHDAPDLAVLDIDPAAWPDLAHRARPRLQLPAVPPGLEAHWDAVAG